MLWLWISLCVLLFLLSTAVTISYFAYKYTFKVPVVPDEQRYSLPDNKTYHPYLADIARMTEHARSLPFETVWTTAKDGVRLHGQYYETKPGAPVQILFHGYHGAGERDFSRGLPYALECGHNALLVDQRAHGQSGGRCLTFGVRERYDVLAWIRYILDRCGADTPIVLVGISMGAATVLMAAGLNLPDNVKGIVADCGYTAPADILKHVIGRMGLPVGPSYFLVRLGGWLFGGFDVGSASATDAMPHCTVPVCFIHGAGDDFVPCDMSRENYRLCAAEGKRLLTVPGAGHGLSFLTDRDRYTKEVSDFLSSVL